MKVVESLDFKELSREGNVDPNPIKSALKTCWKKIVLLTLGMAYFPVMLNFVLYPYSIELYTKLGFLEKQVMMIFLAGSIVAFAFTLLGGYLGDKYGWKKIVLISAIGSLVTLPILLLHNLLGLVPLYVLSSLGWGAMGMYASEFVVKLRNTGAGTVFGLIGLFPAVLLLVVLPLSIALYGIIGSFMPIMAISEAITVVSIVSLFTLMKGNKNEGSIS